MIHPAFESVVLKKLPQISRNNELLYNCNIPMSHKVEAQALDVTPVQSKDGHFLLIALFEEPVDNYVGHSKIKFVKL